MLHWGSFSRKHFDFQLSSLAFISQPECEGLTTLDLSLRESAEENKNTDTVNKNVIKVLVQSVPRSGGGSVVPDPQARARPAEWKFH